MITLSTGIIVRTRSLNTDEIVRAGPRMATVDATCCLLMRSDQERMGYLKLASTQMGIMEVDIVQSGEAVNRSAVEFPLLSQFWHLRL